MTEFDYRLAVLTHGRMETLTETLDSFFLNVTPSPSQVCVYCDGVPANLRADLVRARPWLDLRAGPVQQGFCAATGQLWRWASEPGPDYVFHLEHDFVVGHRVDLRELAAVLDSDHSLAQMALVRGPVSAAEVAAGGLIESRPGQFVQRETCISDPRDDSPQPGFWEAPWLQHRSFFTTNPSLMRREFMVENPWPTDGEPLCEGRFGIELVERGYDFGYWGDGSRYVDHIGVRTGIGY